jgi:hypothetical protein
LIDSIVGRPDRIVDCYGLDPGDTRAAVAGRFCREEAEGNGVGVPSAPWHRGPRVEIQIARIIYWQTSTEWREEEKRNRSKIRDETRSVGKKCMKSIGREKTIGLKHVTYSIPPPTEVTLPKAPHVV